MRDLCLLFALAREGQGFRRNFPPTQRITGAPCRAYLCGPASQSILVMETSIGSKAVQLALGWLFNKPHLDNVRYEPKRVLFAGFAGSLAESLHVGDLIWATEVIDLEGNRWPTTWSGASPEDLVHGPIMSSPHLVATPEEKRSLAQTHGALAVDMESAACARLCTTNGIPFGCLRAISDDVATALSPQLVSLLTGGRVSWQRVVRALLRRPTLLKELMRLGRDTRLASDNLGSRLGKLLGT